MRDADDRRTKIRLLRAVVRLANQSFWVIVFFITMKMVVRVFNHDYVGISDVVIGIFATSVFGEVLAVLASLIAWFLKK